MEAVTAPPPPHTGARPLQNTSLLLPVEEQSQIGAARRIATTLARDHGLGADAVGRLAIVVTEAATNIVRHATRGVLVVRAFEDDSVPTIEVLALDQGPGIVNVERAMQDGYSTVGTAGQGLGGIRRLSHLFAMHSQRGIGTALLARIAEGSLHPPSGATRPSSLDDRLGVVCVPLRGQTECGDAWRVTLTRRHLAILVVDGLGHGPGAATASATATDAFPTAGTQTPGAALASFDQAMRGTRGAALSFVVIDETSRTLQFCGVGNVDARVLTPEGSTHLIPQNGIVGHTMPTLKSTSAPWPAGSCLVMHSDGVSARWRLDGYVGLWNAHPALIAGVVFRDFARERDDATVLVLADGPPSVTLPGPIV